MSGSIQYLRQCQSGMPPAPMGWAYLNFTARHDGIGMRPAEGLLPEAEKDRVIETVKEFGGLVSMRTLPDGGESPYELNTTFFEAMSRTINGPDAHHVARFFSQTILVPLESIPTFYIHSLLATPNDHEQVAQRGMNRGINRHRWDYRTLRALLDDPESSQAQVMKALSHRLQTRKKQTAFHSNETQFTLNLGHDRVFGIWRQSLDRKQSIFALHKVSADGVTFSASALNMIDDAVSIELITGAKIDAHTSDLVLAPYQCILILNKISFIWGSCCIQP